MKKLVVLLSSAVLSVGMFAVPVLSSNIGFDNTSAYSYAITKEGYFSGMTGTMNSIENPLTQEVVESKVYTVSAPTLPKYPQTTKVVMNVRVSSKSNPFYLVVKSPSGMLVKKSVSSSGEVVFEEFKGEHPGNGKWQVSIITQGDVSTASTTMKVYYNYEQ